MQSFLRSEENDRRMNVLFHQNNALVYTDFLFGKPPATDGYMKKGQKTPKNLEFRVKNKENRQKRV